MLNKKERYRLGRIPNPGLYFNAQVYDGGYVGGISLHIIEC